MQPALTGLKVQPTRHGRFLVERGCGERVNVNAEILIGLAKIFH